MENESPKKGIKYYVGLWFKWMGIVFAGMIALSVIIAIFSPSANKDKTTNGSVEKVVEPEETAEEIAARMNNQRYDELLKIYEYHKDGKRVSELTSDNVKILSTVVELYKINTSNVLRSFNNEIDSISSLAKKAHKEIIRCQTLNLKEMRNVYCNTVKDRLWEEDVNVVCSGTTIKLTGSMFAANRNIKIIYESMSEMLYDLRFKRVEFMWRSGASEYTYYTIYQGKDSDEYK